MGVIQIGRLGQRAVLHAQADFVPGSVTARIQSRETMGTIVHFLGRTWRWSTATQICVQVRYTVKSKVVKPPRSRGVFGAQ